MDTLSSLGIKIESNAKEATNDLKNLELQAAKTEQASVKYANSSLILSQKTQTALAAEKAAHVQNFAAQLAQMAQMKEALAKM